MNATVQINQQYLNKWILINNTKFKKKRKQIAIDYAARNATYFGNHTKEITLRNNKRKLKNYYCNKDRREYMATSGIEFDSITKQPKTSTNKYRPRQQTNNAPRKNQGNK